MIEIETIARKWGNSVGITLPKEVVDHIGIKPDKPVRLFIQERPVDLSKIIGKAKLAATTQQLLDEAREGER